ncbi:hypothetical protein [Paenarthrobacter ureafaciens]|uniref:hypothetical protein n=1 Tax=Paenarthrobacter ureafaciens TaxID=37931 RepID=UPI001F616D37|nr:hypothetical protein [Paenarthrobacter ureafaciens]
MERRLITDWTAARANERPEQLRDEAGAAYDSAERRQELAASLEGLLTVRLYKRGSIPIKTRPHRPAQP